MVSEPSMASSNANSNSHNQFRSQTASIQTPLLLLSNMSNLMSVKLDSTNFIVWKHQLSSILKAYSMIEYVDGTVPSPTRFLTNADGALTTAVNPEFQLWNSRDQGLLALINSTLSHSVLSMVIELHNLKKGSEYISSYLQKVKNTRDKLVAVGTLIDNEELLHIILKGLPREYGLFCSAIRTRNEPVTFEEIMVLLQTEEHSASESSDSGKDLHPMAMFASAPNNRTSNSQSAFYGNNTQFRGRGRNNSQRGRGGRFHNSNQYTQNQFPQSPQGNSQFPQKPEGSRPQCQICGKLGHQALDYYHRMDFAYQGRHPPAKLAAMASTSNGSQGGDTWLTNTGATDHFTANLTNLQTQAPYQGIEQVSVGNGQSIPINHIGNGQLSTKLYNFRLQNLLHSSRISSNLLSVHKLCKDNNCSCYFDSNKFLIQDLPSGKVLYKGLSKNGLYPIHTLPSSPSMSPSATASASPPVSAFLSSKNKWQLWHHRLGHPSDRVLVSAMSSLSSCMSVSNKHVQHHYKHCLIGYPAHTKGYICLNPATQRTYISRHVLFNETEFLPHLTLPSNPVAQPEPVTSQFDSLPWLLVMLHTCPSASVPSASCPPTDISQPIIDFPLLPHITLTPPPSVEPISSSNIPFPTSAVSIDPPIPDLQSPSLPTSPATLNTHPMQTRSKHGIFKPKIYHTISTDYTHIEPPTYQLASKYPQWCTAMDEEFSALQRQHTWSLVPPPIGKNIVGCKWVFKLKRNSDGSISRYKARLVAKGFHQQYGIDFEETFSPVVKPPTVRLILALAVTYNWPLRQLDVRNSSMGSPSMDSSRLLEPGNNSSFITQLILDLSKVFELKDMGSLSYFLGLQIQRSTKGLTITQTKYAIDLLTKHNMAHCSPCKTPCVPHVRLSGHCGQPIADVHAYRSLVGALHYLTFTRPGISFAVHQVCQFMNAPSDIHFTAAKHVLRYLKGTLDHGLFYTPGPISLSAFSDADWAGDPNDRRSISGLLVYLGHNPITWSTKKQLTVSRSSTEAEYRALASASAEVCWLRTLVKDLGLYLYALLVLWCDNVSALAIASNPVFHARTKHIEVDFHFIRERVLRKDLQVKFVSTVDQLVDIFTKGLSSHRFQELQSKLLVPVDTIRLRGDDEVNDM
uniref:Reverse transcriptase Ty1/copia-type domain-containing protein n=1 Tax=Fagus sylvatica TaxID=28930 RepID=A0A2N9FZ66_FAGSY